MPPPGPHTTRPPEPLSGAPDPEDRHRARAGSAEVRTIAGTFLAYGALFFDRLAPLYVVGLVAADTGATARVVGTLAMAVGIGWAGAMVLARWASGRWSDRRRVLVAAVVSGLLGLVSVLADSWWVFIALRGLGGLVAGSAAPAVTALAFAAAPPRRRGLDLGIVQSSTRLVGSLVSPVVVTSAAVLWGWRGAMTASAVVVLAGAGVLAVLTAPTPGSTRQGVRATGLELHPGGRRDVLLCTAACTALLAWLFVFSQSAVPLVQAWLGVGPAAAGRLVGLFGLGAGIASLAVPSVSDRLGRRGALATSALAGGAGGLGLAVSAGTGAAPSRPVAALLLLLAGTAMGGLPLVISIIPAEAVARGDVGRALALPIAGSELLGGAAIPALAAAAASRSGLPHVLGAAAVGVVAVALLSRGLRPTVRAIEATKAHG